jgi:hypothetical protein
MLVGDRVRRAALPAAALAAAEVGHWLVYRARFANQPAPASLVAAHGYLPALLTAVAGLAGAGVLAVVLLAAAAHVAGRADRRRAVRRPALIDLWAALFLLQLGIFGVQELAEAAAAGVPALSPAELLLWGAFGQLPASLVAAVAVRWATTTFESALVRLRTGSAGTIGHHLPPPRSMRLPSLPRPLPAQTAGPSLQQRGPPLSTSSQAVGEPANSGEHPHGSERMPRTLTLIAGLALLAAGACGGGGAASSTPTPTASTVNTCAKAHQSPHVAYLVVQHLSGATIERCAGFGGDAIDGATVMQETATQFQMGASAMCQVDHEPQQFTECSVDQAHWSLWLYTGGAWTAQTGSYAQLQLHDHDALGWRYVLSSSPAPSPPPAPQPM